MEHSKGIDFYSDIMYRGVKMKILTKKNSWLYHVVLLILWYAIWLCAGVALYYLLRGS